MESIMFVLHIVFGAVLAVAPAMMQLAVGPALSKIPAGEDKEKAANLLKGRVSKLVDTAIIVVALTALHFLHAKWDLIISSHLLHVKVFVGGVALIVAATMHFYVRGKKKRLKANGQDEALKKLTNRTKYFEKVVLIGAPTAFILGVIHSHL